MIEPLLASKNLCNLADVLKYPPVPSNLARCPAMLKQHQQKSLQTQVSMLQFGQANWIDTLFLGRSHNSLAKKASCSELAPAHLKT